MKLRHNLFIIFLLLAATVAGFYILAQTQENNGIPPASAYAPNFWFDKDEKYFPTDPLKFYYDGNLNELPGQIAVDNYNKLSPEEKLKNFAVFYKIDDKDSEIVYEYWLFYVFNYGINDHYGDWESVFVFVDKNTKQITRAIGSFHQGGAVNNEVSGDKLKDVSHVWNYVAEGSHSNCPDYVANGNCDSPQFNIVEKTRLAAEFEYNGPRILFNSPYYSLMPIEYLQNYFGNKNIISSDKSPALGMFPVSINTELPIIGLIDEKIYTIPVVGEPPENAWTKTEYNNPYAARPLTAELARDWIGNAADRAYSFTRDTFSGMLATVQSVPANFTLVGVGPAISILTDGESSIDQPVNSTEQNGFIPKSDEQTNLQGMADQLNYIASLLTELNQQAAAVSGMSVRNAANGTNGAPYTVHLAVAQTTTSDAMEDANGTTIQENNASTSQSQDQQQTSTRGTVQDGNASSAPQQDEQSSQDTQPSTPLQQQQSGVVINEVAWMGTKANDENEWIELYNAASQPIDISGWSLRSSDEKGLNIVFATSTTPLIPADGFYLLERTDDNTTSEPAQWFGSFDNGLSNSQCEVLSLYDAQNNLIDKTACNNNDWPAGDNKTYQTMERIDPGKSGSDPVNWASNNLFTRNGMDAAGNSINGTPAKINSVSLIETEIDNFKLAKLFQEFDELTLTELSSPYLIMPANRYKLFAIPVGKTLNIKPGVTVRFNSQWIDWPGQQIYVQVYGTLKAIGTQQKPINLTSSEDNGFWQGIEFTASSTNSELDYVNISRVGFHNTNIAVIKSQIALRHINIVGDNTAYGVGVRFEDVADGTLLADSQLTNFINPGDGLDAVALQIKGGQPKISNTIFKNNEYAVQIARGSTVFDGDTFENNTIPAQIDCIGTITFINSKMNNNEFVNGINIPPQCMINQNVAWGFSDVPYVVNGRMFILPGVNFKIQAGTIIKFAWALPGNVGFEIQGSLSAQGTPDQPIIFTSIYDNDTGGATRGSAGPAGANEFALSFSPESASSSVLENVIVKYGRVDGGVEGIELNQP